MVDSTFIEGKFFETRQVDGVELEGVICVEGVVFCVGEEILRTSLRVGSWLLTRAWKSALGLVTDEISLPHICQFYI